ncbi:MAG: dephospho-CoA kinase [Flavobacteriales bacterium]|nr:dephospho-CoA kinase [Flavobacteriales bacterium]
MIRVGLTGGIGSGKSTVASIFSILGIPIYYADLRAKHLLATDMDLKESVITEFGKGILGEDGGVDRKALAELVFNDEEKLSKLNAIIHPAVGRDYRAWCEATAVGSYPYTIKEAAILFETGGYREMDTNILVTAPEEIRIERVVVRDGVSADDVRSRMDRQWSEMEKIPLADHIITNDNKHSLIEQVIQLHRNLSGIR